MALDVFEVIATAARTHIGNLNIVHMMPFIYSTRACSRSMLT